MINEATPQPMRADGPAIARGPKPPNKQPEPISAPSEDQNRPQKPTPLAIPSDWRSGWRASWSTTLAIYPSPGRWRATDKAGILYRGGDDRHYPVGQHRHSDIGQLSSVRRGGGRVGPAVR